MRYVKTSSVTVTDAGILVLPAAGGAGIELKRRQANVMNVGTEIVYIGGSGVTDATGFPVYPSDPQTNTFHDVVINTTGELYAICANGLTSDLKILEQK